MPTVLIGPSPIRHRPGHFRELLAAAGFAAIEPPGNGPLTPADLLAALPAADALIAGGEPVPASVIAACPKLRVIARTGVGYDAVDVAAATARGIVVAITPGTNHESVAEQAFALLLALAKETISRDGSTGPAAGTGCPSGRSGGRRWGWSDSGGSAGRWRPGRSRSAWP